MAPVQHQGCEVFIVKIIILQKEEKSRCQEETCMFHTHALRFMKRTYLQTEFAKGS